MTHNPEGPGAYLGHEAGDSEGQQRYRAVSRDLTMTSANAREQQRPCLHAVYGMQEVRGSNPLSSTPAQRPCPAPIPPDSPPSCSRFAANAERDLVRAASATSSRLLLPLGRNAERDRVPLIDRRGEAGQHRRRRLPGRPVTTGYPPRRGRAGRPNGPSAAAPAPYQRLVTRGGRPIHRAPS
jgi:hypothetical protein